ncbi:MAG: hypothetical protein ABI306_02595 [Caulobacteraceae bacterium]
MAHNDPKSTTVTVSTKWQDAGSEPAFIVKKGEVYYATLAVWEYDHEKANTDEEKKGCKEIAEHFKAVGLEHDILEAVELDMSDHTVHCATSHRPRPR